MNFIFYKHYYYCVVYKKSCKNEFENNQSSNDGNKYNKNYFNCNSFSVDNNMNCISFPKNYYKINGKDNCFFLTLLNESYYKGDVFYFCEDNCLTSSEDKNKKANNSFCYDNIGEELFLLEDKTNCENSNFSG